MNRTTVIITITAEEIGTINPEFYDYSGEDRIRKNISYDYSGEDRVFRNMMSGDYEVFYSGQNQGRSDYQLEDNVNASSIFRIYYRKKRNSPFTFLGITNISSIVNKRTVAKKINSRPNERLRIRLVIPHSDISETEIPSQFEGSGKYKKAILKHSGFAGNFNINKGFYTRKV